MNAFFHSEIVCTVFFGLFLIIFNSSLLPILMERLLDKAASVESWCRLVGSNFERSKNSPDWICFTYCAGMSGDEHPSKLLIGNGAGEGFVHW